MTLDVSSFFTQPPIKNFRTFVIFAQLTHTFLPRSRSSLKLCKKNSVNAIWCLVVAFCKILCSFFARLDRQCPALCTPFMFKLWISFCKNNFTWRCFDQPLLLSPLEHLDGPLEGDEPVGLKHVEGILLPDPRRLVRSHNPRPHQLRHAREPGETSLLSMIQTFRCGLPSLKRFVKWKDYLHPNMYEHAVSIEENWSHLMRQLDPFWKITFSVAWPRVASDRGCRQGGCTCKLLQLNFIPFLLHGMHRYLPPNLRSYLEAGSIFAAIDKSAVEALFVDWHHDLYTWASRRRRNEGS